MGIADAINSSHSSIDIAVYSLNNSVIISAIASAKARGVKIKILTDRTQAEINASSTLKLADEGFDIRIHSHGKIMHNKFAIFDQSEAVTGSFNWTEAAQKSNEENCLFTNDKSAVDAFEDRFKNHLWIVNTKEKSDLDLERLRRKHARDRP